MKRKAAATLKDARLLMKAGRWNGAANRCYYAVYQALVGEFEARGRRPGEFARVDLRYPDKWPHWLVVDHCRALGLDRVEAGLVVSAAALRVQADYTGSTVDSWAVECVLSGLPTLFAGLGIPVRPEGDVP